MHETSCCRRSKYADIIEICGNRIFSFFVVRSSRYNRVVPIPPMGLLPRFHQDMPSDDQSHHRQMPVRNQQDRYLHHIMISPTPFRTAAPAEPMAIANSYSSISISSEKYLFTQFHWSGCKGLFIRAGPSSPLESGPSLFHVWPSWTWYYHLLSFWEHQDTP